MRSESNPTKYWILFALWLAIASDDLGYRKTAAVKVISFSLFRPKKRTTLFSKHKTTASARPYHTTSSVTDIWENGIYSRFIITLFIRVLLFIALESLKMDFYIYHGAPKAFYARKNNAQVLLSIPHRYNNKSYTILLSATLQVKVFARSPFGNQLFWFGKTFFTNQVVSCKILGAMATKMVATWRIVSVRCS